MTSWIPGLDASHALLAELHGDPRFTQPDVASPCFIERTQAATRDLIFNTRHADDPDDLSEAAGIGKRTWQTRKN